MRWLIGLGLTALALASEPAHIAAAVAPESAMATDTTDATGRRLSDGYSYLSWCAPYRMPRAATTLAAHCGVPHPDTLWLTVDPDDDVRHLYGFDAALVFHPQTGDTLTPYWHFGGGDKNPSNVRVEFPSGNWPTPNPFPPQTFGATHYDFTPSAGTLDITFATVADSARFIPGHRRYALARIILPTAGDPTCLRPVCIEWKTSLLAVNLFGSNRHLSLPGSVRYACYASSREDACAPFVTLRKPAPWTPHEAR